jgi:parallel beta-helix repeat protein
MGDYMKEIARMKRSIPSVARSVICLSVCAILGASADCMSEARPRASVQRVADSISASLANCSIAAAIPSPPGSVKTFTRGPGSDDSGDIQKAVDALREGDWLVFPAGNYSISKHVTIAVTGVTLYGKGATIKSSSADDGGLLIQADGVSVYGFTLNQDSLARKTTPWSGGIAVFDNRNGGRRRVLGVNIVGNTVNHAAAAAIFLYKASYFTVSGNTVFRSWADGIHATGGASAGRIVHNTVSQNGDDMVAVVSYAGARNIESMTARYKAMSLDDLDRDIYIADNELSDTYWGRGVAVVGGSDVTIANNQISRTPTAAGIYLLRENSYTTFGDHNILVRDNSISQVETLPPTYKPANFNLAVTRHGAIEISSQMSAEEQQSDRYKDLLSVGRIAILNNTVRQSKFAGMRIGANSGADKTTKDILIKGNDLDGVGTGSIAAVYPGADSATLACSQNHLDGVEWTTQCDKGVAASSASPTVTGASLKCAADGTIVKSSLPNPPTGLGIGK